MAVGIFSVREQEDLEALLASGELTQEGLQHFRKLREQARENARQSSAGWICYVEPQSQCLYVEDGLNGTLHLSVELAEKSARAPAYRERWGQSNVLCHDQDGKLSQLQNLSLEQQGLRVSPRAAYLHPATAQQTEIGLSPHYYSPYKPTMEVDAYDLFAVPERHLLFVMHRFAGKVTLVDLQRGKVLQQFHIRRRGSHRSINISVHPFKPLAYLTDNENPELSLLHLDRLSLEKIPLPLGTLGNLCLSRNGDFLYLESLEPQTQLLYVDLETLNVLTFLDLKGGSLCSDAARPVDLMQHTPDKELLLFMTYLNEPQPFTPVVHVIDTHKTRTIRRYAIKEGAPPQHLALAQPNPLARQELDVREALKRAGLLRNPPAPSVSHQIPAPRTGAAAPSPIEHELEEHRPESGSRAGSGPPLITLPDHAESVIVDMLQSQIEEKLGLQLSKYPFEKRVLRSLASDLKQELEHKLQLSFRHKVLQHTPQMLQLSRQALIQQLAQIKPPLYPLYLPREACPLCATVTASLPCPQCQFSLEPVAAPRRRSSRKTQSGMEDSQKQLLERVSFLKEAGGKLKNILASKLRLQQLQKGETLIEEGQMGTCMYFLIEGQLRVSKHQSPVATLVEGDIVGEMAIISSDPRNATVQALEDCVLLRLERSDFLRVVMEFPSFSQQLKKIALSRQSSSRKYQSSQQRQTMEKIQARMALSKLKALRVFAQAPASFFEALSHQVTPVAYMPKKEVCVEGQEADRLYVIVRGQVDVLVQGKMIKSLNEGDIFGEMAWLLQQERTATVRTRSYCKMFELRFAAFSAVLSDYPQIQKQLETLAQSRQDELAQQVQEMNAQETQAFALSLPGLDIQVQSATPRGSQYYLSTLEEKIVCLDGEQVTQLLGQNEHIRLFQPTRAEYDESFEPCLLIADTGNDRIVQIEIENGEMTQCWGDHRVELSQPQAACYSPQGWLLVADTGNQRLLVLNAQHDVVWEHREQVISPSHVSFTPEGHILYCDQTLHQVMEINRRGEVLWSYGTALIAGAGAGELASPGFALRLGDDTWIADTGNQRVLRVDIHGELLECLTGTAEAPLIDPKHLSWDDQGLLMVHSETGETLSALAPSGDLVWQATLLPA